MKPWCPKDIGSKDAPLLPRSPGDFPAGENTCCYETTVADLGEIVSENRAVLEASKALWASFS